MGRVTSSLRSLPHVPGPRKLPGDGFLALEDGTVFHGESVGAPGFAFGEAVFTTAMTGYQEVVTDPSYAEQVVCFTAPMVGNYGVAPERSESGRVHARGVVMREARGPAWTDWLHAQGTVALSGIDTRSLVLHLRGAGAMRCAIVAGEASEEEAVAGALAQPSMAGRALAAGVSTEEQYVFARGGRASVAVVDYGVKRSILDRLAAAGAGVTVYPHDAGPDELAHHDAVLLSNGPGDPACWTTRWRRFASCSAACRCSASASATSCWRGRSIWRRSSCRSATAARTIRCWSGARARCS